MEVPNPFIDQTPHLTTALTGPLLQLEEHLLQKQKEIESWFQSQWKLSKAPVYGSVDLRNAGFKLAPIDMNLFPAGFNNLNPDFMALSIDAAREVVNQLLPDTKNILVIPEKRIKNWP